MKERIYIDISVVRDDVAENEVDQDAPRCLEHLRNQQFEFPSVEAATLAFFRAKGAIERV